MLIDENNDVFLASDKVLPNTQSKIYLPNLHLNYYINKEKEYLKGVCLDFGFFVISGIKNEINSDVLNMKLFDIKKELIFMAESHIRFVIKKWDFDLLFKNRVVNKDGWENFAKDDNKRHSQLLKNSIESIKIQAGEVRDIQGKIDEIMGRVEAVSQQDEAHDKLDAILASVISYQFNSLNNENNKVEHLAAASSSGV